MSITLLYFSAGRIAPLEGILINIPTCLWSSGRHLAIRFSMANGKTHPTFDFTANPERGT